MGLQSASPQECIVSVAQLGECSLGAPAVFRSDFFVLCEVAQSFEPFQVARVPMKPRKRIVQAQSMAAYTLSGSSPATSEITETCKKNSLFAAFRVQWPIVVSWVWLPNLRSRMPECSPFACVWTASSLIDRYKKASSYQSMLPYLT